MGTCYMEMIQRNGFWWPVTDDWCWRVIHDELPDLELAIGLARGRELAVQAGGNVGVWASYLAARFKQVITVEPDAINYECLVRNVPDNVTAQRAGFGAKPGTVALVNVSGNAGAHYIGDGATGDIPIITIDSLDLPACDLLCLDIEGHEPHALLGAEVTIRRFRPVIAFEEKGLSERYYGVARDTAERWLVDLGIGYKVVAKVRADVLMTCPAA